MPLLPFNWRAYDAYLFDIDGTLLNTHDGVHYHPSVDEAFVIAGDCQMGDRLLTAGCYLYRPPGILHGPVQADPVNGATGITRFSGPSGGIRDTGDEFPRRDVTVSHGVHALEPPRQRGSLAHHGQRVGVAAQKP